MTIYKTRAISLGAAGATKLLLVLFLVVILVVAGVAAYYGLSSKSNTPTSSLHNSQTSSLNANLSALNQSLASLAYAHWNSIAQKNLTAVMSQYSPEYENLYWFGNGNANLGPPNGKHDCNVPLGQNNCSGNVRSAWQAFFDNVSSPMQVFACGFNILGTAEQPYRISTRANVTFFLVDSNLTISVPYGIDFQNVNGQFYVQRDWFGFPGEFATVQSGHLPPPCD